MSSVLATMNHAVEATASSQSKRNCSAATITHVQAPESLKGPMNKVAHKLLLGAGPTNLPTDILQSMAVPMIDPWHSEFTKIMDEVKAGVQYAFQTENNLTFVLDGTGHAGLECAFVNLLEQHERLLVISAGFWGQRAAKVAERLGVVVEQLIVEPGRAADMPSLKKALEAYRPQAVFIVQGESSTGVNQPLDGFGALCHSFDALLIVDVVASLGAVPFFADRWQVDCAYAATQKVLNAPPGLSPITFSHMAVQRIKSRKRPVASFYFDAISLGVQWGCFDEPRLKHHTEMVSSIYCLRAALARLAREGIEQSWCRHSTNAQLLINGLERIGLRLFVDDEELRLPCITSVVVPRGANWLDVQEKLWDMGMEIADGLGPTNDKVWRIGLMGINSSKENVERILGALATLIPQPSY